MTKHHIKYCNKIEAHAIGINKIIGSTENKFG